jgi:hypothetical protein
MTLDGVVYQDPIITGAISHSYASIAHNLKESEKQKQIKNFTKDKIHSQSKFFVLKGAEKLPSHYKERMPEITFESKVKVYGGQLEI